MVQLGPRLKTQKYWDLTLLWYSQDTKYSCITCTIECIQNCSISWMVHQIFLKISIKYVPSLDKDKDIFQSTVDVFQSLWMLLLPSVMSDTHLTFLHGCYVPFLHGSSAVEEKTLLSGTHRDYTNTCSGRWEHTC